MKTTIYFVRHAQPIHKEKNDYLRPLTAQGLQDRMVALEILKDKEIDVVISSPYVRSYETVAPIAAYLKKPIFTDYRLRERENGIEGNRSHNYIKMRWDNRNYHEQFGESINDCQQRNVSAIKDILNQYNGKSIVIGTHGTACTTIINYYQPQLAYKYFMDIIDKMPFILEMIFDDQQFISMQMLGYVYKEFENR